MYNKQNITWLASYPKSGNTWFRSFFSALRDEGKVNINHLKTDGNFSNKAILENILELDADILTEEQAISFRRILYTYLSENTKNRLLVKIHDAFSFSPFDLLPLVPEKVTHSSIYIVRNPLDVAISFANHYNTSIEGTILEYINMPNSKIIKNNEFSHPQFPYMLGTWNNHVESWLTLPTFPVHVVRYEDLKSDPFTTFKNALKAVSYPATDSEILQAIEATQFEKLKEQEEQFGFKEKSIFARSFFTTGLSGNWKKVLSKEQITTIKRINEPMMRQFGYWD